MGHVLIIDDEEDIRILLSDIVKSKGLVPKTAENSSEALKILEERVPRIVILDVWLHGSDLDGLGILEIIKKRYPLVPVIVISGHTTIETAVTAIKMGAYDYIEKPFTADKILTVLKRACEVARLKKENIDLKSKVVDHSEMIGNSSAINKLRSEIEKVAPTSGRVMITGPTGSGKELAARLIHKHSRYSSGPFVIFSPASVSEEKAKNELFGSLYKDCSIDGYSRGSIIEAANNGTLYIDEVTDLSPDLQSRLLKFLQDNSFEKVQGTCSKINIRFISATAKNIHDEIKAGRFRQDLYYRLNVVPINVPPLVNRKEDVPLLVQYFVKQLAKSSGLRERRLSTEAVAALQAYCWPGNIRQLRNIIEWILIMSPLADSDNNEIKASILPPDIVGNNRIVSISKSTASSDIDIMSMPLAEARKVFETQYLSAQMSLRNNNISRTAVAVGMERSALHRKLKLLNITCSNRDGIHRDSNNHIGKVGDENNIQYSVDNNIGKIYDVNNNAVRDNHSTNQKTLDKDLGMSEKPTQLQSTNIKKAL